MIQFFASIMQLSDLELEQSVDQHHSLVQPQRQPIYASNSMAGEGLEVVEELIEQNSVSDSNKNINNEVNMQNLNQTELVDRQYNRNVQVVIQSEQSLLEITQASVEPLLQPKQEQVLTEEVNLIKEVILPIVEQQEKNMIADKSILPLQQEQPENFSQALLMNSEDNKASEKNLLPELQQESVTLLDDVSNNQQQDNTAMTETSLLENHQEKAQQLQEKKQQPSKEQNDINISIGKIEVHAAQQATANQLPQTKTETKKHLSLDDYVQLRLIGQR